ncbi:hypothetical protein BD770DRAFT_402257 [Pilaira anomala]|nr:hypothetical protein BD770DRAFT_402257 [Pilaira anomala]
MKREPSPASPSVEESEPSKPKDDQTELVDSQVDGGNDAMSVSDGSIVDEDEQMRRDQIAEHTMCLDEYTPVQIDNAIQEVYTAQEISPVLAEKDGKTIIGWSLVKHTSRAIALTSWLERIKYANLNSSTSIVNRRPSQFIGESLSSEACNHSN